MMQSFHSSLLRPANWLMNTLKCFAAYTMTHVFHGKRKSNRKSLAQDATYQIKFGLAAGIWITFWCMSVTVWFQSRCTLY